ncbi:hypothetical protein DNTS_001349, partial [Danionella cerebrum]
MYTPDLCGCMLPQSVLLLDFVTIISYKMIFEMHSGVRYSKYFAAALLELFSSISLTCHDESQNAIFTPSTAEIGCDWCKGLRFSTMSLTGEEE